MHSASDPAWPKADILKADKQFRTEDDTLAARDTIQKLSQLNLAAKGPSQPVYSHGSPAATHQPLLSSCDLAGIADHILSGKARRIVIMAGAGISVSSGIPDFRTPGTGLYSQLERFNLPWPEAVFDIRFFRHNPKPFYMLAKELFPGGYMPTPAHYFMRLLHKKGLLLTAFTQNIDGLEQLAGLPAEKVVPAHGSFDGAHCIDCGRSGSIYAVQQAVYDDDIATCTSCGGLVKPDIVFFGEPLPARFHRRRLADMQQADLLIVMGTSLVVQPFASMIDAVPESTPRLLINMNKVGEQEQADTQQQKQKHSGRSRLPLDDSSSSSDSDDDDDDAASCSGFESDATALTASNSSINLSADNAADSGQPDSSSSSDEHAAVASQQQQRSGFDFDSGVRDVAHLSTCDEGVMQLANLLGWGDELQEMIRQGAEEFEAARQEWED
eukprot:GHUV01000518.1.p1 GENE.GHUV01000518.1~~GHUV01000518.1.p1  ORF type:complete len:441 (+),score=166.21 GHUV01000518.1:233-1555(+)